MGTKPVTTAMMMLFAGAMFCLALLGAVTLFTFKSGSAATPAGILMLSNYTNLLQAICLLLIGGFVALIQKETGVTMPSVPSGSLATATTQVTSTQTVETPAAPVAPATAPVPVVAAVEPKVVPA